MVATYETKRNPHLRRSRGSQLVTGIPSRPAQSMPLIGRGKIGLAIPQPVGSSGLSGLVIGIDPGIKGAAALLSADGRTVEVRDMPTFTEIVGGKERNRLDLKALGELLRKWKEAGAVAAVVEQVQAMSARRTPDGKAQAGSNGAVQAFAFGGAYMAVRMGLVMLDIPVHLVTPQKWKGTYKLRGGKDGKDDSRALAARLFPDARSPTNPKKGAFELKNSDGRAEAALIASWGRMMLGNPFLKLQPRG